jgi:hypothetical protein
MILVLLLCLVSSSFAKVIQVKASSRALSKALTNSIQGDTLELESGVYRGKFIIPPRRTIISKELHKAVINGSGHNRAVVVMHGTKLYGISVTGAKVGIYSEGIDSEIVGCRVYNNRHSGIVAVASFPLIKDNIIYRNSGSGITLWDISTGKQEVSHNTIAFNGNHGITIGGVSEVSITNNIIAFNHKLKIKVNEESTVVQKYNNYFLNVELNELLPEDNFSFNPYFNSVTSNDFTLSDSSRCSNSGSEGSDIGSEIFANFNN